MELIDFYATWCGPCKVLAGTLDEIMPKYPGIKLVRYDVEENSGMCEKYAIRNLPTLVLTDGGKEVGRVVGALSKEKLCEWIDSHI